MAREYKGEDTGNVSDYAYRKGLDTRYRKELEDTIAGKPYDRAAKSMRDQYRQAGAQQLAASGTRNIGALTDVTQQLSRQAASQMADLELDKSQARLSGIESLQAMDTLGSKAAKEQGDFDAEIRKFAEETAGVWDEQNETANFIQELIDAEERKGNTENVAYLKKRQRQIRGGDAMIEGDVYEDV
jgi:hypothetical protein